MTGKERRRVELENERDREQRRVGGPVRWEIARAPRTGEAQYRGGNVRYVLDEDGRRVQERLPALAHEGDDYYSPKIHPLARSTRYIIVVRHDGHVVPLLLTNGSGHIDTNTEWAGYQRAKARHFGWFPLEECPVRLIKSGWLKPDLVLDQSLLTAKVCPKEGVPEHGCKHGIAERNARRSQRRSEGEAVERSHAAKAQHEKRAIAEASATGIGEALKDALGPLGPRLFFASEVERAIEALREVLADGPLPSTTAMREVCAHAGCSQKTVHRARDRIGVVAKKRRGPSGRLTGWTWALGPGGQLSSSGHLEESESAKCTDALAIVSGSPDDHGPDAQDAVGVWPRDEGDL